MTSSRQKDAVLDALAAQLEQIQGSTIWLADEQMRCPLLERVLQKSQAFYLSNRIDQVDLMRAKGIDAAFNDFDHLLLKNRRFDHLFIRAPKQRLLAHHLLNLAPEILESNASVWIAGLKGEGIKTHVQRAEERLGGKAQKIRSASGVGLYRLVPEAAGPRLDDENYSELRQLELAPGKVFWSKPGIYGWNKIDQGSQSLLEVLHQLYPGLSGKRVLDLGCGYGYLTVATAELGPERLVATDNHAGAILAAQKNLQTGGGDVQVLASDCGASIEERFDLILCNPPFHQGFKVTQEPHQKFLAAITRLLLPGGRALVVINSFLRIDKACGEAGLHIANSWSFDKSNFTVLELTGRG